MATSEARDPPSNTREPREAHKLDAAALGRWLSANVGPITGDLAVRQFKGGQSNPTYWIGSGALALVLRKKPPGQLLPSAHAVEREFRVMRALRGTDVPVPDAVALCEDPSVIGTPFFVMRYVPGVIYWNPCLPELPSNDARASLYRAYVRTLAAIHRVDVAAVGLGDFGKTGGYVARQVERWSKQYEASKTADVPAMNALTSWLADGAHLSSARRDETTLIHGDYRLDNMLFATDATRVDGCRGSAEGGTRDDPSKVLAVVDWELSTLGHPISDLAYACMGYRLNLPGRGGLAGVDVASLGIPTEAECADAYAEATGRSARELAADYPYFMAFGLFRLAAIAQGVYKRSLQGNASADDAGSYGAAAVMLAELGCDVAGIKTR